MLEINFIWNMVLKKKRRKTGDEERTVCLRIRGAAVRNEDKKGFPVKGVVIPHIWKYVKTNMHKYKYKYKNYKYKYKCKVKLKFAGKTQNG